MPDMTDDLEHEQQVDDLRREIDRLQRRLADEKNKSGLMVSAVERAIKQATAALDLPKVPKPVADRRRKDDETAVVILSDWQLGKKTPSYDSDICAKRIRRMTDKVVQITDIQRLDHPVKRCAVFLVGDMVEGELIFPGQHWEIDSSLYRQVAVDGPRILGGFLRTMLAHFEKVDVYAVIGNHGRIGGRSSRDMHPDSNADRMLYTIVQTMLEGEDRISWQVPERDWYTVADLGEKCRFMLLHGDQVRGFAGLPWYGWTRKVMGWSMMGKSWGIEFEYVAAGHFHTPVNIYINGVRLWVNASTESHNPYALEQLAASGEPAQWLLYAKPGQGVTAEYLVQLEE